MGLWTGPNEPRRQTSQSAQRVHLCVSFLSFFARPRRNPTSRQLMKTGMTKEPLEKSTDVEKSVKLSYSSTSSAKRRQRELKTAKAAVESGWRTIWFELKPPGGERSSPGGRVSNLDPALLLLWVFSGLTITETLDVFLQFSSGVRTLKPAAL